MALSILPRLYVQQATRWDGLPWFLASVAGNMSRPSDIYFRVGEQTLYEHGPAYFRTEAEAVQAGIDAGFEITGKALEAVPIRK